MRKWWKKREKNKELNNNNNSNSSSNHLGQVLMGHTALISAPKWMLPVTTCHITLHCDPHKIFATTTRKDPRTNHVYVCLCLSGKITEEMESNSLDCDNENNPDAAIVSLSSNEIMKYFIIPPTKKTRIQCDTILNRDVFNIDATNMVTGISLKYVVHITNKYIDV